MTTASISRVLRVITLMLVLVYLNIFIVPCCVGQMAANEDGWVQNPTNQHYYRLTEPMSWLRAEDQANKWGGHLVTINNRGEELWLRSQFGAYEFLWTGFTDIFEEGNWQWISGETVTYTNWWPWEPNDEGVVGEIEGAAIMNWGGAQVINGEWFYYYGNGWNDNSIDNRYRGIVEIPQLIVTFWDKEEPTREVSGAAADGASEVIIKVTGLPENAGPDYVQISLPNGEEDGSLDPEIKMLNGVFEQTYTAPKAFVRKGHEEDIKADNRKINLRIIANRSEIEHEPLCLVKPPVIMLHGLWGKISDFDGLNTKLINNGFMFLCRPGYNNSASFQANDRILPIIIDTTLDKVHESDYSCSKVDIVAHSMGGLLAKRLPPDFAQEKVRKIITVGSPYLGSPLADLLINEIAVKAPVLFHYIETIINNFIAHNEHSLSGGALHDLRINGGIHVNADIPGVDCRVVVGLRDVFSDSLFGQKRIYLEALKLIKGENNDEDLHSNIFGTDESDWIVSASSQLGDAIKTRTIPVEWHVTEPKDTDFEELVIYFLNEPAQPSQPVGSLMVESNIEPESQDKHKLFVTEEKFDKHAITRNAKETEDTVEIIAPVEGQICMAGQNITISVIGTNDTTQAAVFVFFGSFSWTDIVQLPWEGDINIPSDSVGSVAEISVIGLDTNMNMTSEDRVNLMLESDISLEDILFGIGNKWIFNFNKLPGQPREFQLYPIGKFSNGYEYSLDILTEETVYTSSNENVAVVDSNGLITALSSGTTEISVMNSGVVEKIQIVVEPLNMPSAPQLIDDFNDNTQDPKWDILESDHDSCWLAETNERLELRSAGGIGSEYVAMYLSRAWRLAGPSDFAFQVDFHYIDSAGREGMLFLLLTPTLRTENMEDRVAFAAGYDRDGPCFRCDVFDAGEEYHSDRVLRTTTEGTLYVRYIAESDELILNYSGRDNSNSWQVLPGLLRGLWASGPLSIGIGGVTFGAKLDSGEAYLDNFVIETGDIVHPADDNCDYTIGDLEMAVYRARWRQGGVTDKDLHDAELLSKAKRYYWNPVSQNFKVAEGELTYIQICSGTLEAGQVVGGSDSTATGSFKVLATEDGNTVKLEVEHTVTGPTLLCICEGDSGTVGTVILSFENPVSPFTRYFTEAEINQMEDCDNVYIDILDASHPQGAIRGQAIYVEDFCAGEGAATLSEGSLGGCLVNNESNGGGNGFLRLCHANFPNQNAYDWCGLNFEHIFNGVDSYDTPYGIYDQGRSRFSPRKDPCKLLIHSSKSASLIWTAEDSIWGMDTEMRYTLKEPHYVDLECCLVPREYHSYRGWLSTFWASYMNHAKDRKIYFYGIDLSTGQEDWITWGEDLEQNGFEAGVISHVNAPDLSYDPEVYSGDIVADANKKFITPFYFGLVDGDGVDSEEEGMPEGEIWTGSNDADAMVYIMMFDQDEPIRFCMWNWGPPFGTGLPSNPAWDWQYVILGPNVGQEYTYRARLVFKPWEGIEDVVNEYETWLNELSVEVEGDNIGEY